MNDCKGKHVYFDQIVAKVAADKIIGGKNKVKYLRVYKCPKCRFYHLTKKRN